MLHTRLWKALTMIGLVCLALLAFMPAAQAFEGRGGDRIVIGPDEVIDDDLYVGANTFVLDGTVKGDLIVGGTTVEINGTVEGDLMAGGQSVTINGTVMDDVRVGAFAITLGEHARITDDALIAGYSLDARPGSQIDGDLTVAAGQALLAGDIGEDVLAGVNGLALRGNIGGNVDADVGEPGNDNGFNPFMFIPNMPAVPSVPGGLTVSDSARIAGDLKYSSVAEVALPASSVAGQIRHETKVVEPEEVTVPPSPAEVALNHVRRFVALLLVGLGLVWFIPSWTRRASDALQTRPLPSLGWGVVSIAAFFVAVLVILIAMILLAIVLGFITLDNLIGLVVVLGLFDVAALTVLFGVAVAYITKIVVSYCGGRLILGRLSDRLASSRVWPLVLGLVIFILLTAIPRVGGLINLIVVLFGLGALWMVGTASLRRGPTAEEVGEMGSTQMSGAL